jgi:flavodoxin
MAKERGLSSTYLGSKGKLAKDALKKQRKLTNNAIRDFNNYFKNKPIDVELARVFKALTQITNIRASLDKMNITFNKMFFGYYSKVNALLFDEYKKILDIRITPEITSEASLETDILQEIEKSGQERGLVSYVISKERPFTTEEFSSWLRIFSQADLTTFNINISDIDLKNKLFTLFHSDDAKKLYDTLVKAKINIIRGSDIGYYQIAPAKWFHLMTRKISILNRADNIVSLRVNTNK